MEISWHEKRRDERVPMQIPAFLSVDKTAIHSLSAMLLTTNISGGGAYVVTSVDVPVGTKVDLSINLPFKRKIFGTDKILVSVYGTVVRNTPHGVAISFADDCRINYSV